MLVLSNFVGVMVVMALEALEDVARRLTMVVVPLLKMLEQGSLCIVYHFALLRIE